MTLKAFACAIAIAFAFPSAAQEALRFTDLAGWWSADPVQGRESSHLALQFFEKDGEHAARLVVPAVGVYDLPLGSVTISGNSIATKEFSFALTWNPATQTLSGYLPADSVPVYTIPVEFKRSAPFEKPAERDWKGPRPKVVWSVDTGAHVWAGIERDASGVLFVGTSRALSMPSAATDDLVIAGTAGTGAFPGARAGSLLALDRATGAIRWIYLDPPSEEIVEAKQTWGFGASPVVADGVVYAADLNGRVYALVNARAG